MALKHNSYVWGSEALPINAKTLTQDEIALRAASKINMEDLWHFRMGHLNYQYVCKLRTRANGIVFSGDMTFCEPCELGKMKKAPYKNKEHKTAGLSKPYVTTCRVHFR